MGMGRKKDREKQQDLWVAADEIVTFLFSEIAGPCPKNRQPLGRRSSRIPALPLSSAQVRSV